MNNTDNPYEILGVSENSSKQEIRRAYIELVKQHHPDRIKDEQEALLAEEKLKEINFAYDQLCRGLYKNEYINNQNQNTENQNLNTENQNTGDQYTENWYTEKQYTEYQNENKYTIVRELLEKSRFIEAEMILKTITSEDAQWYYLKGMILLNYHKYEEALSCLDMAVKKDALNRQYKEMYDYTRKQIEELNDSWNDSQKRSQIRKVMQRIFGITDYLLFGVLILSLFFIYNFVEDFGRFVENCFLKSIHLINLAQMSILKPDEKGLFVGNISFGYSLWYITAFIIFAGQMKVYLYKRPKDDSKRHILNVYISIFIFAMLFIITDSYMYIYQTIIAVVVVQVVKICFCKLFDDTARKYITYIGYAICAVIALFLLLDAFTKYSVVTGENIYYKSSMFSSIEQYSIADIECINISCAEEKTYDWDKNIEGFFDYVFRIGEKGKFKYYNVEYNIVLKNGIILKLADSPEFFDKIQSINSVFVNKGVRMNKMGVDQDKVVGINDHLSPVYNIGTGSLSVLKRLLCFE